MTSMRYLTDALILGLREGTAYKELSCTGL
jgi:hypothetical protein